MKLSIHDIEFSYNGTPVLNKLNASVSKGDFVALVGPNGSGKSTLIKCLNGILKLKKGAALIDDRPLDSFSANALAREMAYVPQSEQKTTALTVFDTVLLGRKPYIYWKPSEYDLKFTAEILKTMQLENMAMKAVNKLSGGQQQTVSIARALAQEPDILLLDEPIANLDIKHQIESMEILKKLSAQGITIIIALHDINMALRYAGKIIMLKEGRIFSCGGRETITKDNIENLYDIKVRILGEEDNLFVIPEVDN